MVKVSIIVPVYNADKYLERCIKSLLTQTLEEIEIILINDGSTDNSLEICNMFAKHDNRIKVISQKNRGVSVARNTGINVATGNYIAFVDADDFVEQDMYKEMYTNMENNNSELCLCNFILQGNNSSRYIKHSIKTLTLNKQEICKLLIPNLIAANQIISNERMTSFRGPWTYLYKKDIIYRNNIRFDEEQVIGEDFIFNLNYLFNVSNVSILNEYYYNYCLNNESATQKYRENWWDIHKLLIKKVEYLIRTELNNQQLNRYQAIYLQRIAVMKFSYLSGAIVNEIRSKKSFFEKINQIKNIMRDDEIKNAIQTYDNSLDKLTQKMYFLAIKKQIIVIFYLYYQFIWRIISIKRY